MSKERKQRKQAVEKVFAACLPLYSLPASGRELREGSQFCRRARKDFLQINRFFHALQTRTRQILLLVNLAVAVACWIVGAAVGLAAAQSVSKSEVELGLKISPVSLTLQGKDLDRVGWGSYLVNAVGDCGGCHTFPQFLRGGDPFQGTSRVPVAPVRNSQHYLAGGFCFGKVISSNLTPNLDTGLPANMSLQQFITAMRSGNGSSSGPLHVMPWPTYHNMTDGDVTAIYQYLRAIPHAGPCNSSCPPSYTNSRDCPNPAPPR